MKGLIILDLDETLITRLEKYYQIYKNNVITISKNKEMDIYIRPYLNTFLSFLCNHPKLDVALWSAGTYEWVKYCCENENILGNYSNKFKFIWTRNNCIHGNKPISKVKEEYPNYVFYLHIDDFQHNNPNELLLIKKYEYGPKMKDDDTLLLITLILKVILNGYPVDGSVPSRTINLYQKLDEDAKKIGCDFSSSNWLLRCHSN